MNNKLQGKIALVTGSTSGIGKAIATQLATLGATVVLVARNKEKAISVISEIKQKTGNQSIDFILADLKSQKSLRNGVAEFKKKYTKLDILVNQAGLVENKRVLTEDGMETMFAVNHLAYFMLFNLLLEELKAAGDAKVLNITGGIEAAGAINFEDLQCEKEFGWFKGLARTKLANVMFTYEAARRLQGTNITVNCLNPGGVKTDLGKNTTGVARIFMAIGSLFFSDPDKAAARFVQVFTDPELKGVTGKYFKPDGKTTVKSSEKSYDENVAKKLWQVSAELTHLN